MTRYIVGDDGNRPALFTKMMTAIVTMIVISSTTVFAQSNIAVGTPDNPSLAGWTLHFHDEFDGAALDREKWTPDVGYYLNADAGTWGWGNSELQYYRDHIDNVYVRDGHLNLTAFKHRQNWPTVDPNRYAEYASGKVITRGKFFWKYGRIDFCASLPTGQGFWPALWMMPQSDVYGGWAQSGEIDVMEAKGRLPGASSGAIHFGGAWPNNAYRHGDYTFPSGKSIADFNVYTVIWEEAAIKWYVNGNLFLTAANSQWHSNAANAQGNQYAPFDQDFYIIMNLAVGGHFDDYKTPPDSLLPATMRVDYVRVYKPGSSSVRGDYQTTSRRDPTTAEAAFAGISGGRINLYLDGGIYSARLYDLRGKMISKVGINAVTGINATGLRVDKLPKGFIVLDVRNAAGASVLRRRVLVR